MGFISRILWIRVHLGGFLSIASGVPVNVHAQLYREFCVRRDYTIILLSLESLYRMINP